MGRVGAGVDGRALLPAADRIALIICIRCWNWAAADEPDVERWLVEGRADEAIASLLTALDLADARIPVTLVEKGPSLGGRMAQLDKTFPTMDCSI